MKYIERKVILKGFTNWDALKQVLRTDYSLTKKKRGRGEGERAR